MWVGTRLAVLRRWHEHICRASRRPHNVVGQEGPIWKLCLRLNQENVIVDVSLVALLIYGKNGMTMNMCCSHTANRDRLHTQSLEPLLTGQLDAWETGQGPRIVERF